jgi:hypothetical protein
MLCCECSMLSEAQGKVITGPTCLSSLRSKKSLKMRSAPATYSYTVPKSCVKKLR